ncbi:MAG: RnfABCDGE type electron transport complex subunit G [Bacteroidetes bacterium]|nr:RnfABCDGE type electron transport complex subunit G [Bacteroidota bacterium]
MAKKESTFSNMVISLSVITLTASIALGFVYELTKAPIAAAKYAAKMKAINEVLPAYNNLPNEEVYKIAVDNDTLYFYPAREDNKLVGTAIETFTKKGFSGNIKLMVGILPDGTINDIVVLEHKETPGLGDKMSKGKSDFSLQFHGKNPENFNLSIRKDGGDVDAITATTISSRAYCDAVKRAYNAYMKGGNK